MEPDVCQFGHLLAPGSDPITLTEIDPQTGRIISKETKLLRRHVVVGTDSKAMTSEFRPGTADEGHAAWASSMTEMARSGTGTPTEGYKIEQAKKAAEAEATRLATEARLAAQVDGQ